MGEHDSILRTLLDDIKKAIDAGRMDIIKAIISSDESKKVNFIQFLSTCCLPDGNLLHFACKIANVDLIRILLQCGIDPSVKNNNLKCPLEICPLEPVSTRQRVKLAFTQQAILAISTNNVDALHCLLQGGLSCDSIDSEVTKNSLLHWAVNHGNVETVVKLLDCGANVNITNANGVIPLHEAVIRGEVGILEELLYFGADKGISAISGPYAGKTAVDLAADTNANLLEMLEQPGEFIIHQQMLNDANQDDTLHSFSLSAQLSDSLSELPTNHSSESRTAVPNSSGLTSDQQRSSSLHTTGSMIQPSEAPISESMLMSRLCPPPKCIRLLSYKQAFILPLGRTLPVLLFADFENQHCKREFTEYLREELNDMCGVLLEPNQRFTFEILCYPLSAIHHTTTPVHRPHVIGVVDPLTARGRKDAYTVLIQPLSVSIRGVDIASIKYGFLTFFQILSIFLEAKLINISLFKISDWCDLPRRGVLIDLSTERHLLLDVMKRWIHTWSRLKANEVHFFLCLRVVMCSEVAASSNSDDGQGALRFNEVDSEGRQLTMSVSLSFPINQLQHLIGECLRLRMMPTLTLDTNSSVEHLGFLTEHPCLQQLLDLFPSPGSINLSPRMSLLLCDTYTGLLTGSEIFNECIVNRPIILNGSSDSLATHTQVPPAILLHAASGHILLASDVFHRRHRHPLRSGDTTSMNGSNFRAPISEISNSTCNGNSCVTDTTDMAEANDFAGVNFRRVWPCVVEYVLLLSSAQDWHNRLTTLNKTCTSFYLALSTNTWCSVSGQIEKHIRHYVNNILCSSLISWLDDDDQMTSSVCGILSCEWSGGGMEGAALTHSWFSAPLHVLHLSTAWNASGCLALDSHSINPEGHISEESLNKCCEMLLSYLSYCVSCYVHKERHLNHLQDYVVEIDKFENFLLSSMRTETPHSLLLLDWRILETNYWDELNKLQLSPYYYTIRLRLKALAQLRESTSSKKLLGFYLRYVELFCRFIQVIRKCQASESSVLNRALMTDLANRLLSLSEDGKEMFSEWYAPVTSNINSQNKSSIVSRSDCDPFIHHMKVMLCRLVPECSASDSAYTLLKNNSL